MPRKLERKISYLKGDRPQLDEVYDVIGVLPNDAYHQDDLLGSSILNDNDSGESILFLKDVDIDITIIVGD
ncbi:MAG: hypothetical protein KAV87_21175 [Desulfobacteraceae bacterium]|nr:hypothetical protein [Desulfobacteraceae bacterium]